MAYFLYFTNKNPVVDYHKVIHQQEKLYSHFFNFMQAFSIKKWYDIKRKRIHLFCYKVFVEVF